MYMRYLRDDGEETQADPGEKITPHCQKSQLLFLLPLNSPLLLDPCLKANSKTSEDYKDQIDKSTHTKNASCYFSQLYSYINLTVLKVCSLLDRKDETSPLLPEITSNLSAYNFFFMPCCLSYHFSEL